MEILRKGFYLQCAVIHTCRREVAVDSMSYASYTIIPQLDGVERIHDGHPYHAAYCAAGELILKARHDEASACKR